jgi:hypothetical protein
MHERFFIGAFSILITFMFFLATTSAENWNLVEDMGIGTVMLDSDSIQGDKNATVGAKIKIVSHMRSYSDPKAVKAVITYYEFDCSINMYRTKNPVYYFANGTEEKTKETSPWQDSGDNLTQTLREYLCK